MTNISRSTSTVVQFRGRRLIDRLIAVILLLAVVVAGDWLELKQLL